MNKLLEIKGLTVTLPSKSDRKCAISDVSISVEKNEILCVVGESGSGKSVTAFTVMGIHDKRALTISKGEILFDGYDLTKIGEDQFRKFRGKKMAMIFQEPMTALNPVMKVGEQITEILEIHTDLGSSKRKSKAIEAMENVKLPDPEKIFHSYPHELSGGQRQRIMIAMALVLEPDLLIADEPTTALDVTTQATILELIKEIQVRRGMGVLFITHDFGVVADIADRVVVMQHGVVVEQDRVNQILAHPQHEYTKMLIGSVPSMVPPQKKNIDVQAVLELTEINKSFGKTSFFRKDRIVNAANKVSLKVAPGETLGIVGESGSGKSTVARCAIRLIEPDSGSILVKDTDIARLRESGLRHLRREIQIVFQDPYRSLNPRRTVGQSIVEGPINFGQTEEAAVRKAKELMEIVGLKPDNFNRFPHQFSGGQRQRICIARALAMEPSILIADEAVSALDVSVQAQVLELLEDIKKQFSLAVLFITHDLRVAAQICDNIVVMKKGAVVEFGSTHEIYTQPKHTYTRALLQSAPGQKYF
ncbi:MAG: ABC transporter ATP-binding protein [Proteobacteria bacterium]|nr:ABC transporter ATP-binding protein [Pseudomonadota bacterium]MDA0849669.1 ABC transporter ATP-binding protein [Pseudomonadota bacterium]